MCKKKKKKKKNIRKKYIEESNLYIKYCKKNKKIQ